MTRYAILIRFTQQGAKAIKKSPARAVAFSNAAAKAGVKVEAQLWTTGAYDGLLILSTDTEARVLNLVAGLVAAGNVSTETLRAFDAKEFAAIVGR